MKMVALIPARAGSKRIPGKNTKLLAGHPLVAYTITAALESGVFSNVVVSTEDDATAQIATDYGAQAWRRGAQFAADESPDIEWVREIFTTAGLNWWTDTPNAFAILRPTAPFRTAETIKRAYKRFWTQEVHSMRAVQPVKEHPSKMWVLGSGTMTPALKGSDWHGDDGLFVPAHSRPTQSLWPYYVQNASLEMAWTFVVKSYGTISGNKIAPFFTHGYEGFDLNTMDDWREAERLIQEGLVELPSLSLARVSSTPAAI